ncbi:metal-dependent hydrolase [Rhodococcus sp. Q]|uniref:metal-dependent hydrolase n=1 Tax=Rhodococcus sp. Q TaxID=2502252 RepID=UPI0010F81A06|nr:metal-dependent hydrolase [Rhodococcus sp. Q]
MVMGATHAVSGAVAGLLAAQVLPPEWGGPTSTAEMFTFAGVCAGAALLPDLDTGQSTVARSFGPVSWALAKVVDEVSLWYYRLTRGRRDPKRTGGHRTLTHTALFAIAISFGVSALVVAFGRPAVIGTLFLTLGLALRGLAGGWAKRSGWIAVTLVAGVLAALTWTWYPDEIGSRALGVAVGLGCAVHCLGDAITKEGVPFLAPLLPWRGRRWWEFQLPSWLSIRAGGTFERAFLGPVLTLIAGGLALWALDGVPEAVNDALVQFGALR